MFAWICAPHGQAAAAMRTRADLQNCLLFVAVIAAKNFIIHDHDLPNLTAGMSIL